MIVSATVKPPPIPRAKTNKAAPASQQHYYRIPSLLSCSYIHPWCQDETAKRRQAAPTMTNQRRFLSPPDVALLGSSSSSSASAYMYFVESSRKAALGHQRRILCLLLVSLLVCHVVTHYIYKPQWIPSLQGEYWAWNENQLKWNNTSCHHVIPQEGSFCPPSTQQCEAKDICQKSLMKKLLLMSKGWCADQFISVIT